MRKDHEVEADVEADALVSLPLEPLQVHPVSEDLREHEHELAVQKEKEWKNL